MTATKKSATTKTRRRRRGRKTRYHTGTHTSPKSLLEIKYRSGWELVVCKYLDADNEVSSYQYETIKIPYLSPTKYKPRFYIPDFIVLYRDGTTKIIEVKRKNQLSNIWVKAKAKAAMSWCEKQNVKTTYEFWTDDIVLPLKKMFEEKEKPKKESENASTKPSTKPRKRTKTK